LFGLSSFGILVVPLLAAREQRIIQAQSQVGNDLGGCAEPGVSRVREIQVGSEKYAEMAGEGFGVERLSLVRHSSGLLPEGLRTQVEVHLDRDSTFQ
jgi:hypothetical protein